jgi:hypothetical protein
VSEFVDECRREWSRLGVPDPIANEMAADLTADLEEAEAEGGSPQDVLGSSAFDPRRFAAAWASARGVTSPPTLERRSLWRPPIAIALAVVIGVLTVGAGLALLAGRGSRSVAFITRRVVPGPGPIRLFGPGPGRVVPGPLRQLVEPGIAGVDVHPLAWIVLIGGLFAVGVLVAIWYWSPWPGSRRYRRRGGGRTPNWN